MASIRVLEKCGFRRIGELTVEADGVVELLYRLDAADYDERPAESRRRYSWRSGNGYLRPAVPEPRPRSIG